MRPKECNRRMLNLEINIFHISLGVCHFLIPRRNFLRISRERMEKPSLVILEGRQTPDETFFSDLSQRYTTRNL
jgi:hypothetical protein